MLFAALFPVSNFRSDELVPVDRLLAHARRVMRLVDFRQALLDHMRLNLRCRKYQLAPA